MTNERCFLRANVSMLSWSLRPSEPATFARVWKFFLSSGFTDKKALFSFFFSPLTFAKAMLMLTAVPLIAAGE